MEERRFLCCKLTLGVLGDPSLADLPEPLLAIISRGAGPGVKLLFWRGSVIYSFLLLHTAS